MERLVEWLGPLFVAIGTCRLEAIRAPGGPWHVAAGAPGPDELERALPQAVGSLGRRITLAHHDWAWALPLWADNGHGVLVVSAERAPDDAEMHRLRAVASAISGQHGGAHPTDTEARPRVELWPVLEAGQQLAVALAQERGLTGIVETVHELLGRPIVVWNRARHPVASILHGVDAPRPPDPTRVPGLAGRHTASLREGEWCYACTVLRPGTEVVAGIWDPDDTVTEVERLVLEQAALMMAIELFRMQSITVVEMQVWNDLAGEMLHDPDRARVRAHAAALGYDFDRPHRLALLDGDEPPERLARRVRMAAGALGRDALVTTEGSSVVLVTTGEIDWETFAQALRAGAAPHSCTIAVSARHPSGDDLAAALWEARTALRLGRTVGGRSVVRFEELGLFRLLAANGDPRDLQAFAQEWIGTIVDYDEARHSNLVETLSTYLHCGGSLEQAAEQLAIHRSTLKYRLGRIAKLLDVDLNDPEVRFNLQLALRARTTVQALDAGTHDR